MTGTDTLRKQISTLVANACIQNGSDTPPCSSEDIEQVVDRLVPVLADILGDTEDIL